MKKLSGLLAVSLVAIMMAPAARADIASTAYVDTKDTAIRNDMEAKANKKTSKIKLDDTDDTGYPTVAAAFNIANVALGDNAVIKEQGDASANQALITNASGTVETGLIKTGMIADSAVTTTKIAPSAVTTAKIADANVTTAKIATSAVTADKLGANAVTTAKIADANVTEGKLAKDSVTPLKVKDGLVKGGGSVSVTRDATTGVITVSGTDTQYNDAAVKADIKKNADAITTINSSAVMNSGATKAKIDTIATNTTAAANAKSAADAAQATANGLKTSKQDKLVATGENANIAGSNGVSVSIDSTSGKITVAGNQAAIDTALAGKQATLSDVQKAAVNSGINATKVSTYDGYAAKITAAKAQADKGVADAAAAQTTANNALPKATYDSQVGTVSAANMGTTATTVVGAIKEIKNAVSTTDGATVKTDQGTTNKDKAVITDSTGKVTTGQIATGMIATGAVNADKIATGAVTTAKIAGSAVTAEKIATGAVTSAKIADGTIVNADISATAAIAQSKISGLTDALAAKFVAPGTSATSTDGTYTLTMKVADGNPTYAWEKIGR